LKTDLIDKSALQLAPTVGQPRRRRGWVSGLILIVVGLVAAIYFYAPQSIAPYLPQSIAKYLPAQQQATGGRAGRGGPRGDGPVPVLAAVAHKADVPVFFDGVGTVRALNTVTVRAQVDGKLMSVNFKEGQDVERDFVLADIDPTIYQAQYDQAVAKKAMDEAQLANARLDLERYVKLAVTNSASKQQTDTQRALVAQLEAQVRSDEGVIENAKATLSYTKIVAPLAGRTGIRQIDAGNIVHATDTTGVVVITQIKPIALIFTLPQQELARVNKAFAKGALSVQALGDDNRTVVDRGTLQVIDNQVDQTTGTVKLKAEFPNADLQLWPGQFVNVKLLVDTLPQVIVVPTAAIQRGPNGTFAYTAQNDDMVAVRPVRVIQQDDIQAVIGEGIAEGDRVVTTGFAQLTDGTKITIGSQEDLTRPAGSERRRKQPRDAPTANAAPVGGAPAAEKASTEKSAPGAPVKEQTAGPQPGQGQREGRERRNRAGG
jgi:multidrug efflux system membrane fusion protein